MLEAGANKEATEKVGSRLLRLKEVLAPCPYAMRGKVCARVCNVYVLGRAGACMHRRVSVRHCTRLAMLARLRLYCTCPYTHT